MANESNFARWRGEGAKLWNRRTVTPKGRAERPLSTHCCRFPHDTGWKAVDPSRPLTWQQPKLPADKMLMPGLVSHPTNLVEHPALVADRIPRYPAIVGRENINSGTDCGLGGRVHADLASAKLRTLVEGTRLASRSLWP